MIRSVRDLALVLVSVLLTLTFMTNEYEICLLMFLLVLPWAIMGRWVDEIAREYVDWRNSQVEFRGGLTISALSTRKTNEIERSN